MSVLSKAERSNFLRQCWRTGHWNDGIGSLALPLRMSLYGLRKKVRGSAKRAAQSTPRANENQICPQFSSKIAPLFCDVTAQREPAPHIELADLMADVDAQLAGVYRLAGGRSLRLDVANLDSLADPEDHHAYHRLYWALRYAVAACFGHKGAAEGLQRDLSQWLDSSWDNSAVAMWPYTLAERIGSLTATLFWIDRSNNQQLFSLIVPIKRQIWSDAVRLSSTVEYSLGVHNHLLNDARGLYLASAALPHCDQANPWQALAFQIWDEYFPKLVLEDGALAEQSSHYHLLLCRTALEYALACRRTGHAMPPQFENRLAAMFQLANELLRPDGSLPRFGDNSPDRTGTDLWGLLPAAHHFNLLTEPPRHRAITPLTIFYCGIAPRLPEQSPEQTPARKSVLYPNGGFAILRSPASHISAELVAHGDSQPCAGTHGDTGSGSYELWWNNHILIREPGCFYSNTDSRSHLYHSADCQNVTSLNGLAPLISKQDARFLPSWYLPAAAAGASAAAASAAQWKASSGASAEFRCETFRRLDPSIILIRRWSFDQAGTLAFEERIESAARLGGRAGIAVDFASRICLGDAPWTEARIEAYAASPAAAEPNSPHLIWTAGDGSSAEMIITVPPGISFSIEPCKFLPDYGVEKPGRVILLAGRQQLPFSWTVRWKLTPSLKALASLAFLEAAASLESAESFAQVKRS